MLKYTRGEWLEDLLLVLKRGRWTLTKDYFLSSLWQAVISIIVYLLDLWAISPVIEENERLSVKAEAA